MHNHKQIYHVTGVKLYQYTNPSNPFWHQEKGFMKKKNFGSFILTLSHKKLWIYLIYVCSLNKVLKKKQSFGILFLTIPTHLWHAHAPRKPVYSRNSFCYTRWLVLVLIVYRIVIGCTVYFVIFIYICIYIMLLNWLKIIYIYKYIFRYRVICIRTVIDREFYILKEGFSNKYMLNDFIFSYKKLKIWIVKM